MWLNLIKRTKNKITYILHSIPIGKNSRIMFQLFVLTLILTLLTAKWPVIALTSKLKVTPLTWPLDRGDGSGVGNGEGNEFGGWCSNKYCPPWSLAQALKLGEGEGVGHADGVGVVADSLLKLLLLVVLERRLCFLTMVPVLVSMGIALHTARPCRKYYSYKKAVLK